MHHEKTIVGGTFDHLHKGHRALIDRAFETGEVTIGLTSNKMAEERKGREVEDYEQREAALHSLAKERGREIEVRKIDDPFGFSLEDGFKNIVVSEETRDTALQINEEREKAGRDSLNIVEVALIPAEDGKPISSTRIHENEIDREGNLIRD